MAKFSLYQYRNLTNGKIYIGMTNNVGERRRKHASGKSGARLFNRAMLKYGPVAFDFRILAIFDDVSAAAYHELAAIVKFGTLSPSGYNLQAGAPGTIYAGSPSQEVRARLSSASKAAQCTPETRARLSAASRAAQSTPEMWARMSAAHKATWADPEVSARNRAALSTPEAREKMSMAAKAHWSDPDVRGRMIASLSAALKKRQFSRMLEPT